MYSKNRHFEKRWALKLEPWPCIDCQYIFPFERVSCFTPFYFFIQLNYSSLEVQSLKIHFLIYQTRVHKQPKYHIFKYKSCPLTFFSHTFYVSSSWLSDIRPSPILKPIGPHSFILLYSKLYLVLGRFNHHTWINSNV